MSTARSTAAPPQRTRPATGLSERPVLWGQEQREALALAVVVAVGLAICGIWWGDTPGRSLHTLGDRLTAAARITGLLGTYLVLVQVLLMARLPWLDRWIGTDRLAFWHRWNGGYTITLLVAHTLLTLWGYAATDHASVAHETNVVIRSYPDVLAATVGLLLLVAVGVASARMARRRLSYETWYFLHLYTYVAIALSFSHQLATGNDFITHPANRMLWAALYIVTFGLVVVFRVAVPVRDAFRYQLRVSSVMPEGPNAASVYVTGKDLDRMQIKAGQFFRWRFLTRDRWFTAHPYSLSVAPNRQFLRITAKAVGDHSRDLSQLKVGTRVMAEGPYGSFTARWRSHRKVLLIAGGVGITPLRALLEEMPARPGDITLLYRVSNENDVLLRTELEELARTRGATVRFLVGRRDKQPGPLSAPRLRHHVPAIAEHDVFLCGPPGMVEAARHSLRSLGVPRSQIHFERFEL